MIVTFHAFASATAALALLCLADIVQAQPPDGIGVVGTPLSHETLYPASFRHPPHLVLEQPRPVKHSAEGEMVVTDPALGMHPHDSAPSIDPHRKPTLSAHFVHADKMARPPAIQGATRTPVWKTPYSYGHFGASRNRQWSHHHGYHQGYTQWTLR